MTSALQLMKTKDDIEAEIIALTDDLNSNGANNEAAAGVKGPLVDSEGFPRADIDLYAGEELLNAQERFCGNHVCAVRAKRHRLACLQTDHKNIMRQIEQALAQVPL